MITTEREASEKNCVLVPGTISGACMASKCMAWRWAETALPIVPIRAYNRTQTTPVNRPPRVPDDWGFEPYNEETCEPAWWVPPPEQNNGKRRGYCGLAGIPTAEKIEA